MQRLLALIGALTITAAAPAQTTDSTCFTGYAYHRDSGDFVYTEHHEQVRRDGRAIDWRVTYRAPDGEVIAEKTLDFTRSPFVPVFTLEHRQSGDMEGIRYGEDRGWLMIERDGPEGERLEKTFEVTGDTVADAGFHPFVRERFARLMDGDVVRFRFAVAGSRKVIDMRARRLDDTTFEGERAVRFVAELDLFLINLFVDDIEVTYDPETRRLLEYRGVSNMQNDEGDRYPVRIGYYAERPPQADGVTTACGGGQ